MRKLCFCAVLCTLLIGCENAAIEELRDTTFENGIPSRVDASLEGDTTRIELDAELQTVWTADDAVSVFYRTTANNLFRFAGATGDESDNLRLLRNRSKVAKNAGFSSLASYFSGKR